MNTLNGMSSPGANGTIKYGCSQHRWHTKQRWAQTSKALWRAPFQNRPIWFLLWEGNQVARVQLVTRELQGMATMHRQNVFAACRNAARGIQFWDASTGNRHFTGSGLTLPEMCHAGLHGEESSLNVFSQDLQLQQTCSLCTSNCRAATVQSSARARNPAQRAG